MGKTLSLAYFDQLTQWRKLADLSSDQGCVVYEGDQTLQTSQGKLVIWRDLTGLGLSISS